MSRTPKRQKLPIRDTFKKNHLGWRLVVAVIFFFALALFSHLREVRVKMLEPNKPAKEYMISTVEFDFADPEKIEMLKKGAREDLNSIEMLNPAAINRVRSEVEQELLKKRWKNPTHHTVFDDMYRIVCSTQENLCKARFVDKTTYKKMKTIVDLTNYHTLERKEKEGLQLDDQFWQHLQTRIEKEIDIPDAPISFVIELFSKHDWQLTEDFDARSEVREKVEANFPVDHQSTKTKVPRGAQIIKPDEVVTETHLAKLRGMKHQMSMERSLWEWNNIIASFIFTLIIFLIGAIYLRIYHRKVYRSFSRLSLYVTILILTLLYSKIFEAIIVGSSGRIYEFVRYPIIVPFASMLITILLDRNLAILSTFFLTILMGLSLAVDQTPFLFVNLVTGVFAIIFSEGLSKRKDILYVNFKVWLTSVPVVIAFNLSTKTFLSEATGYDLIGTGISMMAIAILVSIFLPLLESIFGILTNVTMHEFLDPSSPLLRRITMECSGTYQHSLVVANLAEAAAHALGANALLCRVASYYHDIGKCLNPQAFIENQMAEFSIHALLCAKESAQVILSHVTEGVSLAQQYSLPKCFIDIIEQHHGTSRVSFFYQKALEEVDGDVELVDENSFRYPGPKPQTREAGIIMMCDSVEAASRSLDEVSEQSVRELVENIASERIRDGQFCECELTFRELTKVKEVIIQQILVIYHRRMKYPPRAT